MTAFHLTWQFVWRSALRILALGALFGGIYGPSVLVVLLFLDGAQQGIRSILGTPMQSLNFMLLAALFGALIGATLGCVLGILIGVLISTITIRASQPLADAPGYVQLVQRSSMVTGGIGTLFGAPLIVAVLFGPWGDNVDIGILAIFSLVPALLAGLAIRRGSAQVAMWYVRTTTPTAPPRRRDVHVAR